MRSLAIPFTLQFIKIVRSIFVLFFLAPLYGCEDTNIPLATEAGLDAIKAVTLSDTAVKQIAARASLLSDQEHSIAPADSPYTIRLQGLVGKYREGGEHTFNYKVYLSLEINAFAMADGTIRVHSAHGKTASSASGFG